MTDRTPISDEEISAFLDGELDGRTRADLAERLVADGDGRRRLDQDRRAQEALREAFASLDDSTDRFADEVAGLAQALSRPRRWMGWQAAAAGIALFLAGWGSHVSYETWLEWRVPEVVHEAAQAHQVFAHSPVRPVETANASVLKEWLSGHLGEDVAIPDLRSVGLAFVGGRLLSSERGPLAQMIYEDSRRRRVSLYVAAASAEDGGPDVEIVELDEVDAGYWRDGDVIYTIVAESSVDQVIQVASAFGLAPPDDVSRR